MFVLSLVSAAMLVIPAIRASAAVNYGSYGFKWPTPNTTVTGVYAESRDSGLNLISRYLHLSARNYSIVTYVSKVL